MLLHGGRPTSVQPVDGRNASWWLIRRLQREIAQVAAPKDVATYAVRFRQRGWNGGQPPQQDARAAIGVVRREVGDVPIVLIGHSMGGRVAVHVADEEQVVGVVGLAPWFTDDTPVHRLTGRHLVAAHGRRDKITSYQVTEAVVGRAAAHAVSAQFVDMGPRGHYLLRGWRAWRSMASDSALALIDSSDRAPEN